MYMETILEIGKAENGFVIEARVPLKTEEKTEGGSDTPVCCGGRHGEVKIICKDAKDLATKIQEIIPKLDISYSSEEAFEKAFKAASVED